MIKLWSNKELLSIADNTLNVPAIYSKITTIISSITDRNFILLWRASLHTHFKAPGNY